MFGLTPFSNQRFIDSYDPFKAMEDFERSFFSRQLPAFKTDIKETENAYILEADLPGFSKEDIRAEIKNGYLTISAEHKECSENKDGKNSYIRKERSCGSYMRGFELNGIKSDEISAEYKDGVLTLTLPKAEATVPQGRMLEIK